jgi:hypothetical protein
MLWDGVDLSKFMVAVAPFGGPIGKTPFSNYPSRKVLGYAFLRLTLIVHQLVDRVFR